MQVEAFEVTSKGSFVRIGSFFAPDSTVSIGDLFASSDRISGAKAELIVVNGDEAYTRESL